MGETPFADSGTPEAVKRPKITVFHFILLLVGFGLGVVFSWQNTELFVPEYLKGGGGQGVATCANNLAQIGPAIESYRVSNGHLPRSQNELVPDFLTALPSCPSAGRMSYRTTLGLKTDSDFFLVECCGTNHEDIFLAPDNPAYDSETGLRGERKW